MADNPLEPEAIPGVDYVRPKELIREAWAPPSPRTFSYSTFYALKAARKFKHVVESPRRRFWIGVDKQTRIPVWNEPPPRVARPGIEVRTRKQRLEAEEVEMDREYRELSRLLRLPKSLQPWDQEPPYLRMRHEYLRRKLKRPKSQRRLLTQHTEWPARVPDLRDQSPIQPATWPWELRRMLIRDGEDVPKVKTDRGAWDVPPGYEDDADTGEEAPLRAVEITWGPNRDFVTRLLASGARFFVFGGTATRFHVPKRHAPNDLDLIVEPSADMAARLNAALAHVGAPPITSAPEEFAQPNKGVCCKGPTHPLNMDLLTPPLGVDFSEHWAAAEEAVMNGSFARVRVASVPTLELLLRIGQEREPARAQDFAMDLDLLAKAVRGPG